MPGEHAKNLKFSIRRVGIGWRNLSAHPTQGLTGQQKSKEVGRAVTLLKQRNTGGKGY